MPQIRFIGPDGSLTLVDAAVGESVMQAAVKHGVSGIIAECGGNCTCATCHVYVRDDFLPLVGAPGDLEEDMLDLAVSVRLGGSRLSCQIKVTEDYEGLEVQIPETQP